MRVTVEAADTPAEREHGLMGRTSLDTDEGMVFVFDGPTDGSFWMKDTLIPLSIAFWDEDGRIVGHPGHGAVQRRIRVPPTARPSRTWVRSR